MICKIYSDLRKYPGKFFSYLRLSIGSFDELLTICENDLTKQDTIPFHCRCLHGSDASSISTWHLGWQRCQVGSAAGRMPGAIYD
jgi:hypothetical protein